MNRIDGKVALITGAANGIGASTATYLANAGAKVILTDIDSSRGEALADKINTNGGEVIFLSHDVSSEEDWKRVIDEAIKRFNGLDVLVNNAGILLIKPIQATSLEEWHKLEHVNIDGVFLGMKHALPALIESAKKSTAGASIINLSSAAGIVGVPNALGYTMTKAAVRHMTKSAAMEFAESGYNIRVNSVHPGVIKTAMADQLYQTWAEAGAFGTHDPEETEQAMINMHPLGRQGQPEDIAKGVVFLASDDSSYMTGAELVIDGGYIAK